MMAMGRPYVLLSTEQQSRCHSNHHARQCPARILRMNDLVLLTRTTHESLQTRGPRGTEEASGSSRNAWSAVSTSVSPSTEGGERWTASQKEAGTSIAPSPARLNPLSHGGDNG